MSARCPNGQPRLAGQAAARGRGDVRRRRPPLRPDQHRAVRRRSTAAGASAPGSASSCNPGSGSSTSPPAPVSRPPSCVESGAFAVGCDFSLGMLRAGRANRDRRRVPLVAGDALHLPFGDGVFDAATISFGLRNVVDVPRARCARWRASCGPAAGWSCASSAGRCSRPFRVAVPELPDARAAVARAPRRVHPDAYVYLAESIRAWPRAGRARAHDRRRGLGGRPVPQPDRRHRRAAPRRAG